ncbi:MAG TPA: 30S ribosomal protein S7 [Candidatus Sumerlaeota bacterium]|nr:MAG: 30S ribosomal protein S7 [candidate division BRC1 bacterium ADurb.Bin183]HOE62740.1 30S ribosomal protein S7 [Candidatus Sumerlaeota bacterium]HRR29732.1 30S ribosomal protein S7 [Candidatus Sumerlaeia bacterium]HON50400.1 30S ribosomal protein S7 [Candidatus Sumerlaeota bacterium]HOR63616.1 30S ribosomal protein S7 [Candidatus Sumerlaeota bacterium]
MPRKRRIDTRDIQPDVRYGNVLVTKFINNLFKCGKKSVGERIIYSAIEMLGKKFKEDEPVNIFVQAVENVKPVLEVRSRRVGGANYQVPIEVRPSRKQALAIRWILASARSRPEKTMAERLANELADAYNKVGTAIKKREDTHKMAEANRAFAHYRW